MKHCLLLIILLFEINSNLYGQNSRLNPHAQNISHTLNLKKNIAKTLSNDTSYDVNFYHLAVSISIDSAYIKGSVSYLFTSRINGLSSLTLDLDSVFVVDSVTNSASSYILSNKELTINFDTTYNLGDTFSFTVHYQGTPRVVGGKGLRYETHNGEPIIASLSTPYLAHTWWPCKDGPQDKADSTFIDITIKDTIISSLPVIAVSNGLLDTVITNNSFKTFKWKHFYPIVPYYVMVAISNYQHFQQTYEGTDHTFPIDYYVFDSNLLDAQNGVFQVPQIMDYFTSIFGPYPFRNEKYGMSQLGFYGGIENQTNSIVGNLNLSWLQVTVHELAHQWFADMITCDTWNHAWLNEGFASYAEALYREHQYGFSSYKDYMTLFEYYGSDTLYLNDVSDPFNIFQGVIYSKGAYVLHMLRGVVGDSSFFNAIYDYTNNSNHQYAHAKTENLQQVFENESGQNLDYFFSQWIYDARYPVYTYNYLQDLTSGELDLSIVQTQSNNGWRNTFIMPIEIKFEFTDLTDTVVKVFNDIEAQNFSFLFEKEVSNVILDPDKWILKNAFFDSSINVDISEINGDVFEIYPNPANQRIYIKSDKSGIEVTMVDLKGLSKLQRVFKSSSTGLYLLDVEDLSNGIYLLKIKTENSECIKKVSLIK